jgi:hypothetical protein
VNGRRRFHLEHALDVTVLEAGLVAARQVAAIIAVTLIVGLLASQELTVLETWRAGGDPSGSCRVLSRFLGWAYL